MGVMLSPLGKGIVNGERMAGLVLGGSLFLFGERSSWLVVAKAVILLGGIFGERLSGLGRLFRAGVSVCVGGGLWLVFLVLYSCGGVGELRGRLLHGVEAVEGALVASTGSDVESGARLLVASGMVAKGFLLDWRFSNELLESFALSFLASSRYLL